MSEVGRTLLVPRMPAGSWAGSGKGMPSASNHSFQPLHKLRGWWEQGHVLSLGAADVGHEDKACTDSLDLFRWPHAEAV